MRYLWQRDGYESSFGLNKHYILLRRLYLVGIEFVLSSIGSYTNNNDEFTIVIRHQIQTKLIELVINTDF